MSLTNSNERYGALSIGIHWLMFLIIVMTFASIELRDLFEKGTEARDFMKTIHFTLGLTILALVIVRLFIMLPQRQPVILPTPDDRLQKVAKAMKVSLYLFMFAMPILGWLILSGADKSIPFYGFDLPALIEPNKDLAHTIKEVHEFLGEIGYWLIGIHAAAALFHHYVLKDNTLKRILPKK
ncbi:cytochrome b [Thiomicrorhabdus sp.]|uniref:cytochrome b n=1 Tax=Thiomicrorhabdus sp. TaxID=2039724 RepID=UPI002AA7736C|nr:cytochrome b [Thiomicrorhabdus sp.]